MYTAFSPGTNLFLVLSAACCIVAFFDGCHAEGTEAQKWVCGILLCILVAIAVAGFHEAKQSAGVLSAAGWI